MNCNDYRKIVHAAIWFGDRIALSQVLKNSYYKRFWSDVGGKVEKDEDLLDAVIRETREETGLSLSFNDFKLIDCFIYPERKIKTFLFEIRFNDWVWEMVRNPEPTKQSDWQLFTVKKALELPLMPSVKNYLENL